MSNTAREVKDSRLALITIGFIQYIIRQTVGSMLPTYASDLND